MAVAEQIGDAGDVACDGPELASGRAADDREIFDFARGDAELEHFVGAAGKERTFGVTDEPRTHGNLRGATAEKVVAPAARFTPLGRRLGVAAVRAEDDFGLIRHVWSVPSSHESLPVSGAIARNIDTSPTLP